MVQGQDGTIFPITADSAPEDSLRDDMSAISINPSASTLTPEDSRASNRRRRLNPYTDVHDTVYMENGDAIIPVNGLVVRWKQELHAEGEDKKKRTIVFVEQKDLKPWICKAWSIEESQLKKCEQTTRDGSTSHGSKVWQAVSLVEPQKQITLRKAKYGNDHFWVVDSIEELSHKRRCRDSPIDEVEYSTSDLQLIADIKLLRSFVNSENFDEAYRVSCGMVDAYRPRFKPYVYTVDDIPNYSEYVNYTGVETINENNRVLDIGWSYRLALYQFQRCFVKWINDIELQKAMLKTVHSCMLTGYNPIKSFSDSVLDRVRARIQTFSKESYTQLKSVLLYYIDYHLHIGLYDKYEKKNNQKCPNMDAMPSYILGEAPIFHLPSGASSDESKSPSEDGSSEGAHGSHDEI